MIIVTGGAGLIGSALIWALNRRGDEDILVVDHLGTSEKWRNLRALRFRDCLDKADFRARFTADRFSPEGIRAVIHLGACSATTETDAGYLLDNNYRYSVELAEFCLRHGLRFLYASSAATYGDGTCGYADDEASLDALRPLNMYGYSKHLFDRWIRRQDLFGHVAGFKFTNVFGPNEWHKGDMRSVVCKAYEQIAADGKARLFQSHRPDFADGEQRRDFLYVKDAVAMILFCLDRNLAGLYNIGSGRAETWNSLVHAIFAALGQPPRIEYVPMPETLRAKYQYHTCAEMDKLRAAGYAPPTTPLADAVADYVAGYLVPARHLGDET
jgi:ADP-L-glycero-D-manno-heptose 6-epimerase